jgi:hypothetical protein
LLDSSGAQQIERVVVGSFDYLRDESPHLLRDFGLPFAQFCVEFLSDGVHFIEILPRATPLGNVRKIYQATPCLKAFEDSWSLFEAWLSSRRWDALIQNE